MDTLREEDGLHTGRSANPSESTLNQLKTPVIEQSDPGSPPFTRGIYSGMYLDKLWTMRQYAGFSDTKSTNQRGSVRDPYCINHPREIDTTNVTAPKSSEEKLLTE